MSQSQLRRRAERKQSQILKMCYSAPHCGDPCPMSSESDREARTGPRRHACFQWDRQGLVITGVKITHRSMSGHYPGLLSTPMR